MMTPPEVKELMRSCKTEPEWNMNCDKVKSLCGGDYPSFWYTEIIQSGIMEEVTGAF